MNTETLLSSPVSFSKSISSKNAITYINELHSEGWNEENFEDPEWVQAVDAYYLTWMPLSNTEIKWCKGQHGDLGYHLQSDQMPPIVIGDNGFIIDGMHRYSATLKANREYILAYVPEHFIHLGFTPIFHK